SLRAALEQVFNDGVPTTITFAAGLDGSTLLVDDSLGTILWDGDNITVTGSPYIISLSGINLTGSKAILQIRGSHNLLTKLTLKDGPANGVEVGDFASLDAGSDNRLELLTVTGNDGAGIYVRGGGSSGGQGNAINDSYVGLTDSNALGCAGGEANVIGIAVVKAAIATQLNGNVVGCSAGDGVAIDGSDGAPTDTQVTYNRIGVNFAGAAIPNGLAGVSMLQGARRVTLQGNDISGNTQHGVFVSGAATGQITITENNIGTNASGDLAVPNGLDGILLTGLPAADTRIDANTIAGNGRTGIDIAVTAGVTVTNNFIGLNPAGTSIMPNFNDGVRLDSGANHNLIGGAQASKNVISGNLGSGVLLDDSTTTLNQVSGNYIGTNQAGTAAVPNQGSGVRLDGGAHHNQVGSQTLITQRNVISGNDQDGVYILGPAHDNRVDGNFIGLNAAGTAALANGLDGVAIVQSTANSVGSLSATVSQFISGNTYRGIYVYSSTATIIFETIFIGVASDGVTPIGNGSHGIWLNDSGNNQLVADTVAHNHGAGIAVTGAASTGNILVVFNNFSNAGLPIDLNNDGPTPNDPGDADSGPNGLLNYPVITAVAGTTISGTTCASCAVYIYRAVGNPAGPGGGGVFVVAAVADGAGNWSAASLPAGLTRADLAVAACEAGCASMDNFSEMSPLWRLSL
ncbi:MAG: right-handed parallel beta-helix repeat-containing protein, partial [Anaerolineales bacterium]